MRLKGIVMDLTHLDLFFKYLTDPNVHSNLKQAAAVFMMRYLEEYWHDDTEAAVANPHMLLSNEAKQYFQANILNLMFITRTEPKLMPVLKNTIINLCTQGEGYINTWHNLMNVQYYLICY